MIGSVRLVTLFLFFLAAVTFLSSAGDRVESAPNSLELVMKVDSVKCRITDTLIVIPIDVTNLLDSVAGFEIWLNLSEPGLLKFETDSIHAGPFGPVYFAKIDTTGTRAHNWNFDSRLLDGAEAALIHIVGYADMLNHGPLAPGSGRLLSLLCEPEVPLGDSLCDSTVVGLMISHYETRFSDPRGDLIGFTCIDSLECEPDETRLLYVDGQIGFGCYLCGDVNNNGVVTISDVVFIIRYIFGGGPAPNPASIGDVNCNGFVSISDVVYLIAYIFSGGPAPCGC